MKISPIGFGKYRVKGDQSVNVGSMLQDLIDPNSYEVQYHDSEPMTQSGPSHVMIPDGAIFEYSSKATKYHNWISITFYKTYNKGPVNKCIYGRTLSWSASDPNFELEAEPV